MTTIINDGISGVSVAISRGMPLTVLTSPGLFGPVEGTVAFIDTANQQTYPVPATAVFWTNEVVTLTIPTVLPAHSGAGTAAAESWQLQITPPAGLQPLTVQVLLDKVTTSLTAPTQVRVNDGVLGGAAQPMKAGELLHLIATQGTFPGSSGTVVFASPTNVNGAALALPSVPATNVLWTPSLIRVAVPAAVAGSTSDTAWQVTAQSLGTTVVPCGPYQVFVSPALPKPTATAAPTGVLLRGQPVTLAATQGTFGPLLGASGVVGLRRTSDPSSPVVPVPGAVWSALTVTFAVPRTLPAPPANAASESWDIILTPSGGADWTGFPTLNVAAPNPQLLLVQPKVVSEREMVLTGLEIPPQVSVELLDSTDEVFHVIALPNLVKVQSDPLGLAAVVRAQVPTISQLQKSADYTTNALLMPVHVRLAAGNKRTPKLPTTVVLPPPALGIPARDGNKVRLEHHAADSELGDVASCEWLGSKQNGVVYVYPSGDPSLPLAAGMASLAADYAAGRLTASTTTVQAFQEAVNTAHGAVKVPVANITEWHEDSLEFTLPPGVDKGRFLVCRDGLPTAQMPIPVDLCDATFVTSQIQQLFGLTSTASPQVPIGFGVDVAFSLTSTGLVNTLSPLIQAGTVKVTFDYALSRNGSMPGAGESTAPNSGTLPLGAAGLVSKFRPEFRGVMLNAGQLPAFSTTWTLTVTARVSGIPNTKSPGTGTTCPDVSVTLPPLTFSVLGLPVPALAVFFDARSFEKAVFDEGALVLLAAPTGSFFTPNAANSDVITLLSNLKSTLVQLGSLFPGFPDASQTHLDVLQKAIDQLAARGSNVDTWLAQFSNDLKDWNDDASSMLLIGPGRTLRLYDDTNRSGTSVDVSVPAGSLMADLWTMHESWAARANSPGGATPSGGFGNKAASFAWL